MVTKLLKTLVDNEQADLVIHGYQAIVGDFSRTVRESLLNKNGTYLSPMTLKSRA